jgi:hypothetical protein
VFKAKIKLREKYLKQILRVVKWSIEKGRDFVLTEKLGHSSTLLQAIN